MTTKRYLEQIGRIEKLIQNKQVEADKVRELCGNMAVQTDMERVQTSNISDPTGRSGTELASISKQIDYWWKKRAEIIIQIDKIGDVKAYEVLTYRYVQHMSIFDMMDVMERTERQICRLLKKSHEVFEKKYGETYLNGVKW